MPLLVNISNRNMYTHIETLKKLHINRLLGFTTEYLNKIAKNIVLSFLYRIEKT